MGVSARMVSFVSFAVRSFLLLMAAAKMVFNDTGLIDFRRRGRQYARLRQFLVAVLVVAWRSSASYILPVGTKASTRAGNETFFLFFDDVTVRVAFTEIGCFE